MCISTQWGTILFCLSIALVGISGCTGETPYDQPHQDGVYLDKGLGLLARNEEVAYEAFTPASEDHFAAIDGKVDKDGNYQPLELTDLDIRGRNAWMLWTGGNELFWDWLSKNGYGSIDFLKLLALPRDERFAIAGLINEPGMREPTDEEIKKYHGIRFDLPNTKSDQYGGNPPDENVYGYPTGILGMRIFKNPEFEASQAAQRFWDLNGAKYYSEKKEDIELFSDPSIIKPYVVGVSCAICHVSFHPLNPPENVNEPKWENISSTVGSQYLRVREVFGNTLQKDSYLYHVMDSQFPGTIDTSLIATDHINNANTMNAIYGLKARIVRSLANPPEMLSRESYGTPPETYPGLWDSKSRYGTDYPLKLEELPPTLRGDATEVTQLFEENPRHVPRVLVDGSDSLGTWVALARVYLNIGTYHQQWQRTHNTILGFRDQVPFTLQDCEEKSLYWHATKLRVDGMTSYFLKSSDPMLLKDAILTPKEDQFEKFDLGADFSGLPDDSALKKAREVFAKGCIACHSSKQPSYYFNSSSDHAQQLLATSAGSEEATGDDEAAKAELPYARDLSIDDLWQLTRGSGKLPSDYEAWAQQIVEDPEFWQENYLSTDMRIPVTMMGTNASRAMATNAKSGHVWEDFASNTFKDLDSVGKISYRDPFSGARNSFVAPGGGPGYYRVPTLISAWATAPFFHNNSLGKFNNDPTVSGRLDAFDDAIEKLLWPEKRRQSSHDRAKLGKDDAVVSVKQLERDGGLIWRTTDRSSLIIRGHQIPSFLAGYTRLPRVWLIVLPWVPAILFLVIAILLLLAPYFRRLSKFVEQWLPRVSMLAQAGKILFAFSLIGFSVGLFIVWWRYSAAFRVIETGSDWAFPWINAQILLLAGISLLAGVAILVQRVPRGILITVCLVASLIFSFGLGGFASGIGGDLAVGPFPKGMPVNLFTNVNPDADLKDLIAAGNALSSYFVKHGEGEHSAEQELEDFEVEVAPALMKVSTCPDLVLDRGHDFKFIQQLTDAEKRELIKLIKTF